MNRSTIEGFYRGVYLSLRASGQVDVNFNTFTDNVHNVIVHNASQLLTIQENDFILTPDFDQMYKGILVRTDSANAPQQEPRGDSQQPVRSHGERADRAGHGRRIRRADAEIRRDQHRDHQTIRSGCRVETHRGFWVTDLNGGIFANNEFEGSAFSGFQLSGVGIRPSGWSVVGNDFNGSFTGNAADIWIEAADDNLVGPGQNADVADLGNNNTILNQ